MEIAFDRKDFEKAKEFIHGGDLVPLMNKKCLPIGAMAWILDSLFKAESEMEENFKEIEK
jgi:hypothetical protein